MVYPRQTTRRAAAVLAAALAAGAGAAGAAETSVSAFSSVGARGEFYQTGPEEATFVGVLSGILYVEDAEGAVEAGVLICPGRLKVNTTDLSQSGSADCVMLTAEGERIYGAFECQGQYRQGCMGELRLTGGTGSRAGIEGGGPIEFLNTMPDLTATPGNIVTAAAVGLVRMPEITFRLP